MGELVQTGSYDEAIAEFTKAIQLSPNDARIYNDRGWRLLQAESDSQRRQRIFRRQSKLPQRMKSAYSGRGVMLVNQNQNDAALPDLNKAIELKPDDASLQVSRFC